MSNFAPRHSEEKYLVQFLDGELSARKAAKVERHLEGCGQCRAELDELRNTLAECVRYRQDVLHAQMPAAPEPWRDLYRDFSRIDESLASDSLLVRLMRPLVHSGAPRWAFVGGLAALIVLGITVQFRQAPSVQAATLLRKAVAVADIKPLAARRIRVRTSHQQEFTRLAGVQAVVTQTAEAQAVGALFQAAHYDWNDPMSARAFQQWRDAQVQEIDQITVMENSTRIRTTAAEGELAAASITLNAEMTPVEERLEFRDQEWIEISEIAEPLPGSGGTAVAHVEVPVRAAELPSRPAALAPGSSASISDEIQVLSALSEIGADLGDPVEVGLSGGKVMVTGHEGISPQRQQKIRDSVAGLANVQVEFSPTLAATVPAESVAAAGSTASVTTSPLQMRLEKQLGGHAAFDRFSTHLLDLDEQAMQRVYALRSLAQKFSAGTEGQFSQKDRDLLREISRKHTAALAEKVSSMERSLVPTLSSLGGTAAKVRPAGHATWQTAAEALFQNATRVDELLAQMLGTTATAPSNALPSELQTALKDLSGNLDECQKLLQGQ